MDAALKKAIDDLGVAHKEYKDTNDERLTAIEKGGSTAEIQTKLDKLDTAVAGFAEHKESLDKLINEKAANDTKLKELQDEFDDLVKKTSTLSPGPQGALTADEVAHKETWNKYIRKGRPDDMSQLAELEKKNLGTDVDPDGGYAVPKELDRTLIELERPMNPMRMVCGQITVSTPQYRAVVNLGGAASGWVGERAPRPETGTPTLTEVAAVMGEVYANPAATQTALDDMFFDAEAWIAAEVAVEFAEQENKAYTKGDGTNKPKGLLDYATAATSDFNGGGRPFGTFEHIAQGAATGLNGDDLINLIHATRAGYRARGKFMMNNVTVADVRKLKTTDGQYLWQPGLQEGQPDRVLGFQIVENEEYPVKAASANYVSFGDFARGYLVVDRIGVRTLRDPFTNKPYVQFYTTKRTGGMARDTMAIKHLQGI